MIYDGHKLEVYDAATNTLYRYTPAARRILAKGPPAPARRLRPPRSPVRKKIEEAISHLQKHASVSGAEPTDVAGQPAYTVRVGPKEAGSLFAGAELSFNADNGTPLRAALYSTAELLAGARTGGHRNLLRPGARLGLLDHAPVRT